MRHSCLVFRIQREAEYYRGGNCRKDRQQQFSASFALLILGILASAWFSVIRPLFHLAGLACIDLTSVVGGIIASVILVGGYFLTELLHYRIVLDWLPPSDDGPTRHTWLRWKGHSLVSQCDTCWVEWVLALSLVILAIVAYCTIVNRA